MNNYQIVNKYIKEITKIMRSIYPQATSEELQNAINYSFAGKMKNSEVVINNIYKDTTIDTTLLDTIEYIISKEPIITPYGVMFKRHDQEENYLINLTVKKFLNERNINKAEMFKYPKGSEMFNKYNLLQLLNKIDANGFYGASGAPSCLFYNLNVAASTTSSGQSAIATSGVAFEAFLANNVKFRRLNEITRFITNVLEEKRYTIDSVVLDRYIPRTMVFEKLIETCGHGYTPTEADMEVVWKILLDCGPIDLNRIFYKNNLFAFMENSNIQNMMIDILKKLKMPYLNPNKLPKEIAVELNIMWDFVKEYVFYNHQYIDRIDRLTYLPRKVVLQIDTDSNFMSAEPWYQYWKEKIRNIDLDIKKVMVQPYDIIEYDDFGDPILKTPFEILDPDLDFDLDNDVIVELKRDANVDKVIPEDGVRFSVINILAFMVSNMVNATMEEYTKHTNSYAPGKPCKFIMKNEFLLKRTLITSKKKNYASIIQLQEGNKVDNHLGITGLAINKSTLNPAIQKALKKVLYDDILMADDISPMNVIKKLMVIERQIFNSLKSGKREFFKPLKVKSISSYDDPMRISGIKASLVWNAVKALDLENIDMDKRNAIDVVKVDINTKNVEEIKDIFPNEYNRLIKLINSNDKFKKINAIAIPLDVKVIPEWILHFIDYDTIINDNIKSFNPMLETLGITQLNNGINYTNILKI